MKSHKIIRIFISSTFCDFNKERKILNKEIFPDLVKKCKEDGYYLQFVDLRWGVPKTAENTHETMKICLKELNRSMQLSPSSYLYIMLGDRYGWQPVPDTIFNKDYQILQDYIKNLVVGKKIVKASELFDEWYLKDENSIDEDYILADTESKEKEWSADEHLLRSVFDEVYDEIEFSEDGTIKYYYSATSQEVAKGALLEFKNKEIENSKIIPVSCFFRKIKGCNNYIDVVDSKYNRLQDVISRLRVTFKEHFEEYTIDITKDNYNQYLEAFRSKTNASLTEMIDAKIAYDKEREEDKGYILENKAHLEFREERVVNFVGRDTEISNIAKFINKSEKPIIIVHGERGSGKSAFHAKIATEESKKSPNRVVVARFVGVTASSNDLFTLISDLCETIWHEYHTSTNDEFKAPNNYLGAIAMFKDVLGLATPKKPLLVIIDALDQLPDTDDFKWIPQSIPENVKIVLGTRSASHYNHIEKNINKDLLSTSIKIEKLERVDSIQVLDNWLKSSGRKEVDSLKQCELINSVIQEAKLPIYLKLLFEKIKVWRSFDNITSNIKTHANSIIKDYFFHELHTTKGHSKKLINRSLAYISLGKNGLSELEILELLTKDSIVMSDLRKQSYNDITVDDTIPFMIWARFYGDIEPYMKMINHLGDLNITFYHEQIADSVKRYTRTIKAGINKKLIAYYDSKKEAGNIRALSSLPYHIIMMKKNKSGERMLKLLLDDQYINAKIESQLIPDLISEFEWLLKKGVKDSNKAVKNLFIRVARIAENRNEVERKKLWDDIHFYMIFRFDRSIHVEFFNLGIEVSNIEKLLPDFNDEQRQYINISCLISKQNYYRRMGLISDALKIGEILLKKTSLPDSFKSMVYYDNTYIDFLAGQNHEKTLSNMQESYNYAVNSDTERTDENFAKGCFSKIVGNFLQSRIYLFNEVEYEKCLYRFFDYLDEVLDVFYPNASAKFGRNKLANILEYIGIICYYNGDKDGASKALKKFKELPVVINSSDNTRERLATSMLLALQEEHSEACKQMQNLIEYKLQQVSLENREQDPKELVESIAQMYYLLAVWYKEQGLHDKQQSAETDLDSVKSKKNNDNGNGIWCSADIDYKFDENSKIKERVEQILNRI